MRVLSALLLTASLAAPAALAAQVAQGVGRPSTPTTTATPRVSYVVLWRTEFLERPDPQARVLAWLDSGQVLAPVAPESFQTGHARIVVNGREGWVDNGYIRRVVVLQQTARVVDTVRVERRAPTPRPGDPRAPNRVSPSPRP